MNQQSGEVGTKNERLKDAQDPVDSSTTKLERRRLIEELCEEKKRRRDLGDYDLLF